MSGDRGGVFTGRDTPLSLRSVSGLTIAASIGAGDGLLAAFYRAYDRAFVLENEKEGLRGFEECLALNSGESYEALSKQLGPFREFVLLASDLETGRQVGGANFIAFPISLVDDSAPCVFSLNLNYIFINPEERRRGYFARLVQDMPDIGLRLFSMTNPVDLPGEWRASPSTMFMFVEQNDPYKLSREDYERDTRYTGLDQIARIGLWARRGARILDFDYVQPALTAGQEPDRSLAYAVITEGAGALSACLLKEHLRRFFGISVLKGRDPRADPVAREQLSSLERLCADRGRIGLIPIDMSRLAMPDWREAGSGPATIRAALR